MEPWPASCNHMQPYEVINTVIAPDFNRPRYNGDVSDILRMMHPNVRSKVLVFARQLLLRDYICRVAGQQPQVIFVDDDHADIWLRYKLLVQPYHFTTYHGRLFNRDDELEWLRHEPEYRIYHWALTGRDVNVARECITSENVALDWAKHIGDHEVMWQKMVTDRGKRAWHTLFGEKGAKRSK